jgi:hypothetical protein
MTKLTDEQIGVYLNAEEKAAIDYEGELSKKRAQLMRYYNGEEYGNEVDGQSRAVTSDVSDVIEWMLPSLVRTFTQGKLVGKFEGDRAEDDQEAEEKTQLSNHVFMRENDGVLTLHNMFKDALLQYTGVVKIYWDEEEEVRTTQYENLSETELQALMATPNIKVGEIFAEETEEGVTYDTDKVEVTTKGCVKYDNIPPEEFLVSRNARDFIKPKFIGHRSPTRS